MTLVSSGINGSVPSELCGVNSDEIEHDPVIRVDCSLNCTLSCCSTACFNSSYVCPESKSQSAWISFDEIPRESKAVRSAANFITCEWLEMNDEPSCPKYRFEFMTSDNEYASDACCYCGTCTDYENWEYRQNGENCMNFYEIFDDRFCPNYGYEESKDNIPASEACCWCGGGVFPKHGTPGENQNKSTCIDDDDWVSITGDTCKNLIYQNCAGKRNKYSADLVSAGVACCCAGGGILLNAQSSSESNSSNFSPSTACSDIQIPHDKKYNCEYFEKYPDLCSTYKDEELVEVNEKMLTVSDVCCICGGGTRECFDSPQWHDSNPNDSYTCKDYEENKRCPIDGNSYIEFGQTANTACCVCGMYMYLNSISQKIILIKFNNIS